HGPLPCARAGRRRATDHIQICGARAGSDPALSASGPSHLSVPMAAPGMRIGLLGGSFDPAHEAHREISLTALKRLGLDQVWWLVTPGNPLKDVSRLPGVAERVAEAKKVGRHPRIKVTGFDGGT